MAMMDQHSEGSPQYKHIQRNDFLFRKHKKQKEEDVVVCDCRYNPSDPDSACGERCLNVLTSTECTPGYCPCGSYCKNQKFQRCEYAKSRLFKTEGRGWGVLADEDIKAGQFIIEYCGEVISCIEAKKRSHAYENQGLRDAYIISLNAQESIDATNKGSLARFINHSCQPNCETRKWNVLGEIRVGIFSKQDIPAGVELAYDYNFEWYGGAKVRCLCGAHCCSGFLGAKSRGFQEDTHVWEDNDARYSVENIPLYDTEEDEPIPKFLKGDSTKLEPNSNEKDGFSVRMGDSIVTGHNIQATALVTEPTTSVPMEGVEMEVGETEWCEEKKLLQHETPLTLSQGNAMISRIRSNSACRNYHIQTSPLPKKRTQNSGRLKNLVQKEVDAKLVGQLLSSKEAREEVNQAEEMKMRANSKLNSVFNEIRPAIEEHERDNQDSVPTSVAEAWIGAHCSKLKADFDFNFSIIKNLACTPGKKRGAESSVEATENDMK